MDDPIARCKRYRRRIMDISQKTSALHIAPAFSCIEMVDFAYHELIRPGIDTFIMSKGHGAIAQYVVLEDMGVLTKEQVDGFCTAGGLGTHPDLGTPGIACSTGSLGHGLGMAVGMAIADHNAGRDSHIVVLMSDGELMEGSTWEAAMQAAHFHAHIIAMVDSNRWITMGPPHQIDSGAAFAAFGWEVTTRFGHNYKKLKSAFQLQHYNYPFALICNTMKGRGVSFMEDQPIWHYRSPNAEEYRRALAEIGE